MQDGWWGTQARISSVPGYAASGNSPLDAGAQYVTDYVGLAAATGQNGGLIFVWNDTRPSRPGVRVRWLQADGTNDPAEPDSGRVATPAGATVAVGGSIEDGSGGVYVAWQEGEFGYGYDLKMNRLISSAVVEVGSAPASHPAVALRAPAPNPASREVSVRVALPSDAPARLELLDLAGRQVRARVLDGAGERTASFDGLDRLAPGLYLLRLTQGRESRFARLAIVH